MRGCLVLSPPCRGRRRQGGDSSRKSPCGTIFNVRIFDQTFVLSEVRRCDGDDEIHPVVTAFFSIEGRKFVGRADPNVKEPVHYGPKPPKPIPP